MGQKPVVSANDIIKVRNYMMSNHQSFIKARPRQIIAQTLGYEDRHFRAICAEIPEIISSSKYGYWILPLIDLAGLEVKRAKEIVEGEERRRMIALYLRQRRQRKAIRNLENKSNLQTDLFNKYATTNA